MPSKTTERPIDIYVRVSRTNDRDVTADGGTASEQERKCRAQLEIDGLVAGRVFTDLDESGGKTSRPEYDKVIERIEDGTSGGVIVFNLKRFGRRTGFAQTIIEIEKAGARFISCQEKIDTTTAAGRAFLRIMNVIAEMELENLTEGWREQQAKAIRLGIHIGPPPAGYSVGPDRKLVPNEFAPVITEAFAQRARGVSQTGVANYLSSTGITTSRGSTAWSTNATKKLLRNRTYLGFVRSGELEQAAHEPLVTEAVFNKVEALFEHRGPNRKQQKAPLSGILRCGTCGHGMSRDYTVKPSGKYFFYRCRNTGACSHRSSLGADIAEAFVFSKVAAVEVDLHGPELDTLELEATLDAAQVELEAYLRMMAATEPGFRAGYDARTEAVRDAQQALEAAIPSETGELYSGPVLSPEVVAEIKDADTQRKLLTRMFPSGIKVAPGRGPIEGRLFF